MMRIKENAITMVLRFFRYENIIQLKKQIIITTFGLIGGTIFFIMGNFIEQSDQNRLRKKGIKTIGEIVHIYKYLLTIKYKTNDKIQEKTISMKYPDEVYSVGSLFQIVYDSLDNRKILLIEYEPIFFNKENFEETKVIKIEKVKDDCIIFHYEVNGKKFRRGFVLKKGNILKNISHYKVKFNTQNPQLSFIE